MLVGYTINAGAAACMQQYMGQRAVTDLCVDICTIAAPMQQWLHSDLVVLKVLGCKLHAGEQMLPEVFPNRLVALYVMHLLVSSPVQLGVVGKNVEVLVVDVQLLPVDMLAEWGRNLADACPALHKVVLVGGSIDMEGVQAGVAALRERLVTVMCAGPYDNV